MPALARVVPAAASVNQTDPVALLATLRAAQANADAGERTAYEHLRAAEMRLNDAAVSREVATAALQRAISHGWGDGACREHREEVEAAAHEARAAGEALGAARRAIEAAKVENVTATAALSAYVPPVTAGQVREAAAECTRLRAELKRLEGLAAATVEPASVAGELRAAQAERRRLLGDAAEGKGDPAALAAAEARVSTLEAQAAERARQSATVAETRAALRERIDATTARAHAADRHAQETQRLFWLSVQAAAFGDYLAAALAVRDAWLRAEAADRYARTHGLKSLAGFGWTDLTLPGASAPIGDGRRVVESPAYLRNEIERACDALRDALG